MTPETGGPSAHRVALDARVDAEAVLRTRQGALHDRTGETVFPWFGPSVRFGLGATGEVGWEVLTLGMSTVLLVTDTNVRTSGVVDAVVASLCEASVDLDVWDGCESEPTDDSVLRAVDALRHLDVDGYVAVGGGSVIDTCKLMNLLRTAPGELTDYLAAPHGAGRPVPGRLSPMVALPTTAGTGSECTATAVVDLLHTHTKAVVSHWSMRPAVAIIDPLNALSCPPAVTASAGYDAVVQAIESLTSKPFDERPPARTPADRPAYVGHNPISAMWCETAVQHAGRFLVRAVADPLDVEARHGMAFAALCSRIGNAGVHVPHANGYAIAAAAHDHRPAGFQVTRAFVPHGQSVVVTAAAAFDVMYSLAPDRYDRVAELLRVDPVRRAASPQTAVGDWVRWMLAETGGPRSLQAFGLTRGHIPSMVEVALSQERVLACAPVVVDHDLLVDVLERSLAAQG
jgi:hydroxyacid-oxoacid transhydrogenase